MAHFLTTLLDVAIAIDPKDIGNRFRIQALGPFPSLDRGWDGKPQTQEKYNSKQTSHRTILNPNSGAVNLRFQY